MRISISAIPLDCAVPFDFVTRGRDQDLVHDLASLHIQHEISNFRSIAGVKQGLLSHLLVINGIYQATDAHVAIAIMTTDPKHMVLAGNQKQLSTC